MTVNELKPTAMIRWITYEISWWDAHARKKHHGAMYVIRVNDVCVHQQWWEDAWGRGQWRDVPVEPEVV